VLTRRTSRRGNAVLIGLMLGTLLGFSALAVDIGLERFTDTQLQAAVDAATLSGASELDGTTTGITRAKSRTVSIAALHSTLNRPISLPASAIQVGTWDTKLSTFKLWDGKDPTVVNAVKVDHTPPSFTTALASVAFGIKTFTVTADSLGVRPTGAGAAQSTKCFLPFAIPDCWLSGTPKGKNPAPLMFQWSPSVNDGIAWGSPDGNPNANDVRAQLLGQCDHAEIKVGDPIYVDEGVKNTALSAIGDILNNKASVAPTKWNASLYGSIPLRTGTPDTANIPLKSDVVGNNWTNTLEGPVALINAGACNNLKFTGSYAMTGVAWAVVYDSKSSGSPKNVYIQLDIVNEHDIWGTVDTTKTGNVLANGDPTLVNY